MKSQPTILTFCLMTFCLMRGHGCFLGPRTRRGGSASTVSSTADGARPSSGVRMECTKADLLVMDSCFAFWARN